MSEACPARLSKPTAAEVCRYSLSIILCKDTKKIQTMLMLHEKTMHKNGKRLVTIYPLSPIVLLLFNSFEKTLPSLFSVI